MNEEAEESVLGALMLGDQPEQLVRRVRRERLPPRPTSTATPRPSSTAPRRARRARRTRRRDHAHRTSSRRPATSTTSAARARIHELAVLVPAVSNAPHYAKLVTEAARLRHLIRVGAEIQRLGYDRPDPTPQLLARAVKLVDELATHTAGKLQPLWLHDALHEPIPDTTEYVEGVLEAGVLADIVGLPYLHKSAVALELATKVARGRGLFLGRTRSSSKRRSRTSGPTTAARRS
jgi:hypothetical protein